MADLTRRDVLTRTVPALAAAGALVSGANLMAQNGQREPRVSPARDGSPVAVAIAQAYRDGEYSLPELPYDYDALEPHIDEQTMNLHHSRHHQAYVNGLNSALQAVRDMPNGGEIDPQKLAGLQRDITFNGGGHILHTVFWATMAPDAGGEPDGEIAEAIDAQFGSFAAFRDYFSRVAGGVKGSGWAILAYEPVGDNLMVFQSGDQDLRMIPGGAPLLLIDVWEHAYYLRYQNNRADYIQAWWNVVNWDAVNDTYVAVRRMYFERED